MPKQHQQKSLLTKPSPSAPTALSLSRPAISSQADTGRKSVNELIHESRHGQGSTPRTQAVLPTSSIHPALRAVFDLPPPTSQFLRPGVRGPNRVRRIPGPPPPPSWLKNSRHAPPEVKKGGGDLINTRWRIVEDASNLPGASFPPAHSLQHLVMKSMAMNWEWHVEYDHTYLAELPVAMKEMMLSYVSIYDEDNGPNPMKVLFPTHHNKSGNNEVSRLDLGKAIGNWATIKKVEKDILFTRERPAIVKSETVPEAWDVDRPVDVPQSVTSTPLPRFDNLKHLSLAAKPGASGISASWHDLLSLASKLPTITSLSIAHWPQPTYTPNASTGRHKVRLSDSGSSPGVIYGGSDFYTAFDNNWREAAGILRTLSRSLYCLKWLDLTGCGEWIPALTWHPDDEDLHSSCGPDWNGSWRDLEQIVLAVGWKPAIPVRHTETDSTIEMKRQADRSSGSERVDEIITRLSQSRLAQSTSVRDDATPPWDVEQEREKYHYRKEVERYMELTNCAKKVAQDLRIIRKADGKSWIQVDFGQELNTL